MGVGHNTDLEFYRVSAANDTKLGQHDLRGRPPLMATDAIDTLLPRLPNDYILVFGGMMLHCGFLGVLQCTCG